MENASKALIIAGGVLIGVLILSLASYLIIQFGSFSRNINREMDSAQINSFNVNFTKYSNRANISAQEVASAINFAKQNNQEYEAQPGDDYYVDVYIGDTSVISNNINSFLDNNKNTTFYYCNLSYVHLTSVDHTKEYVEISALDTTVDIEYNEHTGLITKITFHEVEDTRDINYAECMLKGYNIVRK